MSSLGNKGNSAPSQPGVANVVSYDTTSDARYEDYIPSKDYGQRGDQPAGNGTIATDDDQSELGDHGEMLENHSVSGAQQKACAGNASRQEEQSPRLSQEERISLAIAKLNGPQYNELAPRKLFGVGFGLGRAATL